MAAPMSCLCRPVWFLLTTLLVTFLLVESFAQFLSPSPHGCTFPKFLQSTKVGTWLHKVHKQGTYGSDEHLMVVTILGGVMRSEVKFGFRAIHFQKSYTQTCVNVTSDGAYVVAHALDGFNTSFLCMKFLRRSEDVVLMRHSPIKTDVESVSCDSFYTEHWPMVAERMSSKGQDVPTKFSDYLGGFDLEPQGRVQAKWSENCDTTKTSLPVIELACLSRDVINLDFQSAECVPPGLLMDRIQRLWVLAVYKQYEFIFLVLRAQSRNFWCARIKRTDTRKDQLDMVIFLDLVCDPTNNFTEGAERISFKMFRHVASNRSPEFSIGQLNKRFSGLWYHMDGVAKVNISKSAVYFPDQGQYEFAGHGRRVASGLMRVPLHSNVHDGCSPKVSCLEIGLRTGSVAKYRLAQISALDDEITDNPHSEFCSDKNFDPKKNVFKHVVRASDNLADISVECNAFKPNPIYNFYTVKDNKSCYGKIEVPCTNLEELRITGTSADCEITTKTSQICLASFEMRRGGRILITATAGTTADFSCWVFKTKKDLFYLPSTDCDDDTAYRYEHTGKKAESMVILSLYEDVNHTCTTTMAPTMDLSAVTPEAEPEPEVIPEVIPIDRSYINYTFSDDIHIGAASHRTPSLWSMVLVTILYCMQKYIYTGSR